MDQTHPTRPAPARRATALARVLALGATLAATLAACAERPIAPMAPAALVTTGAAPIAIVPDPDLFCPFGCAEVPAGDSLPFVVRVGDEVSDSPQGPQGPQTARYRERARWASADARIATVSPTGMVYGHAPGDVEISATVGTRTATRTVTVAVARIARVVLDAPTTTTDVRGSLQLKASAIDVQGNPVNDAPIFWFAATPGVATVDETGRVTGVAPGDAMVLAFASFGRSAWIAIHVNGAGMAPALPVATIDVGGTQACATSPGRGATSCWGWNWYGQLGTGAPADNFETFPTPQPVADVAFAQVSAGDFHTCALTSAGEPWCWGDGSSGRLGNGAVGGIAPRPSRVTTDAGFAGFTRIAAGGDHTCALDASGAASCWGFGWYGQLGTGALDNATTPARVATTATFSQVFPALWHSCALGTDGAAWCWGSNDFGQLGAGKPALDDVTPAPVRVKGNARFTAMDSRWSHACGTTAEGEAWCWGRNDERQLGDGTWESRGRPVRVLGTTAFGAIATGAHHTCALAADGQAWCWGNNDWGQLGDNSLDSRGKPAPVHGGRRFVALTAGNNVTCGTTAAGEAWCWGSSHYGMLGNGQDGWDTISAVPVRVTARR